MKTTEEYSLQIGMAYRTNRHGKPIRQDVILRLNQELVASQPVSFIERYAKLCGLVALRNADEKNFTPLPNDFPVLVAPITSVRPYRANGNYRLLGKPEAQAQEALANGLKITLDPTCLGARPPRRDLAMREFCSAVADSLIQPEGSPRSVPTPLNVLLPVFIEPTNLSTVAAANGGEASALHQPIVTGFGKLVLGPGHAG